MVQKKHLFSPSKGNLRTQMQNLLLWFLPFLVSAFTNAKCRHEDCILTLSVVDFAQRTRRGLGRCTRSLYGLSKKCVDFTASDERKTTFQTSYFASYGSLLRIWGICISCASKFKTTSGKRKVAPADS